MTPIVKRQAVNYYKVVYIAVHSERLDGDRLPVNLRGWLGTTRWVHPSFVVLTLSLSQRAIHDADLAGTRIPWFKNEYSDSLLEWLRSKKSGDFCVMHRFWQGMKGSVKYR